jgi:receptor expression-enhancing protein 1/2/3/4
MTGFRVPFYGVVKMLIMLYMVLPHTQGALVLFHLYVRPWLDAHEAQIDTMARETRENTTQVVGDLGQRVWEMVHRVAMQTLNKAGKEVPAGDRIQEVDDQGEPIRQPSSSLGAQMAGQYATHVWEFASKWTESAVAAAQENLRKHPLGRSVAAGENIVEELKRKKLQLEQQLRQLEQEEAAAKKKGAEPYKLESQSEDESGFSFVEGEMDNVQEAKGWFAWRNKEETTATRKDQ